MTLPQLAISVAFLATALAGDAGSPRRRAVPCEHREHSFDVAPCRHACENPGGVSSCHPGGDTDDCVHRVHLFDFAR